MKRAQIFSFLLVFAMLITCCSAANITPDQPSASPTLAAYAAYLDPGDSSGDIIITYDVQAKRIADYVGVETISIYKSNGTYVTTIYGSTSNGLIRTNASRHLSEYIYHGTSGTTYYAIVTVFATIGSDYDSQTVSTYDATAP